MKDLNRREMLRFLSRLGLSAAGMTAFSCLGQGCIKDLGSISVQDALGMVNSGLTVMQAGLKTVEDITPEQAYYIGRSTGAILVQQYKPYWNRSANLYLNMVGQSLAQFSQMPILYDGYHFLLLDSDDINAFATPSGLIFVTRGLVRCCSDEDMLAAVLAHEIAHVQLKHGLGAIKASRINSFLNVAATEGGKYLDADAAEKLDQVFESSLDDIVNTMVQSGYSKSQEYDADMGAVGILEKTGYYPAALPAMLQNMESKLVSGRHDFFATHPSPANRIAKLQSGQYGAMEMKYSSKVRFARFARQTRGV
ncbi:M48 family metallopeptidase [uncultured Desulfobacter sp.]|uniref:M48 family metallopeptidase n=1 Tax=uncultured Desulfobacter sp. TaxID=240139 RepID=UPI002AAB5909|nr:M48 family metallopeptidase [uncultured Desulfobacter sp.]